MSEGVITLASSLIRELGKEVASGALSINYDEHQVIIRFSEDATFLSGDATIKKEMLPIIERVVDVLKNCRGDVVVAGYTDDRPIASSRYRSNWDLSAARAVSAGTGTLRFNFYAFLIPDASIFISTGNP